MKSYLFLRAHLNVISQICRYQQVHFIAAQNRIYCSEFINYTMELDPTQSQPIFRQIKINFPQITTKSLF